MLKVIAVMMAMVIPPAAQTVRTSGETVVLLHGIGHTAFNMAAAENALKKEGYRTVNISYPSRSHDISYLANYVSLRLQEAGVWKNSSRVHFVTHSMGGLVTRRYLSAHHDSIDKTKLGRVVMIAPPNRGSEVADFLKNFGPYKWVFGPAGQELTTAAQATNTDTPYYDLGIIAGTAGWLYPVGGFIIPGAHDGRVAVERTKIDGMKDHLTLPATHSFIAWKPRVHKEIIAFLKTGAFNK